MTDPNSSSDSERISVLIEQLRQGCWYYSATFRVGVTPCGKCVTCRAADALEAAEREQETLQQHDCEVWRAEGMGCMECNPISEEVQRIAQSLDGHAAAQQRVKAFLQRTAQAQEPPRHGVSGSGEAHWRHMADDEVNIFQFTNREMRVMFTEIDHLRAALAKAEREQETLRQAAFKAGWDAALNHTDKFGETHATWDELYAEYAAAPSTLQARQETPSKAALTQIRDLASQTLDAPSDQVSDSVVLAAILAISEKGAR